MNIEVSKCNNIPVNQPSNFYMEGSADLKTNIHDYPQIRGLRIVQTRIVPMPTPVGAAYAMRVTYAGSGTKTKEEE